MKQYFFIALFSILAACQPLTQQPTLDSGLEGYDPDLVEIRRGECEARGGRYGKGGLSGNFVCYEATKDANKPCASASDCDGLCLARSRTCTPIKPLFGCNQVLNVAGDASTLCIE